MRLAVQGPPATRHTSTVADLPTAGAPLMTVEPSTITQRLPMNHWLPPISRMIPVKVSVSTAPGCTWINLASSDPFACSQASTWTLAPTTAAPCDSSITVSGVMRKPYAPTCHQVGLISTITPKMVFGRGGNVAVGVAVMLGVAVGEPDGVDVALAVGVAVTVALAVGVRVGLRPSPGVQVAVGRSGASTG